MRKRIDEKRELLRRKIEELSEEHRRAVIWAIEHYHEIERMCRSEPMTQEQRKMLLEQAERNNDPYLLVLIMMEKTINEPKQ
ncbi:MAG: hypothetical protein IJD60_08525 [Clostridia bacterium]|nr:hypothetical protein [Clostridia bacterium]